MSILPVGFGGSNAAHAPGQNKGPESSRFATLLRALAPGGQAGEQAAANATGALAASDAVNPAQPLTDVQLAELRRQVENSLSVLQRNLKQLMMESGIDTIQPLRLVSDGQGGVVLANFHPDQDKIEQLFKDNPDLADAFHQLDVQASRLDRIEHGPAAGEPIFSPTFGLNLHEDHVQIAFE